MNALKTSKALPSSRVDRIDPTAARSRNQTNQPVGYDGDREFHYVKGLRRMAYLALAGLFFVLAMIGVILPGLPTTPFLLLTSYLLARSSSRLHQALLANRMVGPILRQWHEHRAVEPRVKVRATALIFLAMFIVIVFSGWSTLRIVSVCSFTSIGLVVIHRLPTLQIAATNPHPTR